MRVNPNHTRLRRLWPPKNGNVDVTATWGRASANRTEFSHPTR